MSSYEESYFGRGRGLRVEWLRLQRHIELGGLFCVIVLEGDGDRISPSRESCDVREYGRGFNRHRFGWCEIGLGTADRVVRKGEVPGKLVGGYAVGGDEGSAWHACQPNDTRSSAGRQ